ncbi:MAG: CofH family radical SAM protein [Kiritimatiellia bacterium]|jgi:dehypoxanthine futalosine cyclase|nr:CofH family radical SAM protein [Kiritimatiellia bacterium]MDP6810714.1 CofH family radical SAM protein [Kiritimatiellia bacterium]MDP7023299.1 CofH family radical SAM protein [Kiritimatiellia bacterium]
MTARPPPTTAPPADRLSCDEALELLTHSSLPELMQRADAKRRAMHGTNTTFVHSLNINPTNRCENECELCAFWREEDAEDAYTVTLDAVAEQLRAAAGGGLTDLHVVGGIVPHINIDYYEQCFRIAKSILPDVCIQGLTAVEIDYLARQSGTGASEVLSRLKQAGLDALPGGGAEIFNPAIRRQICPNKISGDRWLKIHAAAHALGMPTNATMLFGHIESPADLVDHMDRLRRLQDQTGGLAAFIPLPFHPSGTRIDVGRGPSGMEIVRTVAVARLFLDNVPHIRVLANYVDRKLLEVLTASGVDDLGGTSQQERIARAAGAPDDHRFVSVDDMFTFVERLGLTPRLVNSVYTHVDGHAQASEPDTSAGAQTGSPALEEALHKAGTGERLSAADAIALHDHAPFQQLGHLAQAARQRHVPGTDATYVVDRIISLTNVCTAGCCFCAFHVAPGDDRAFTLTRADVVRTTREAVEAGATQILIQGGLNPDLSLEFYEQLLGEVKAVGDICVHSLSPAEIADLAEREGVEVRTALERLHAAGLDSLPGGGAEILNDDVRQRVSPRKLSSEGWLNVMRTAQDLGLRTTATMVYGLGETTAQRVDHLMKIRALQDETGGFTAFIPWSFQSPHTALALPAQTGIDYLRIVALSRLVLDNIDHLQAGWVTEGPDLAQLALAFGADDFGGVLMEELVVSAAGADYTATRDDVVSLIARAGLNPVQRTTQYERITDA